MKLGKKTKISIICVGAVILIYFILCLIFPLPLDKIENDYSTIHTISSTGELLRVTLSKSGKYRIKAHLNEISDYVKKGFISYEDKSFYYNPGINPAALFRALFLNTKKGRIVSGGSTITMQLAKMMEPKKRTYFAKFAEAFRALQLVLRYSKDDILEIYLNTIPMGGNIEGVAAASYIYFNKPPSDINPAEAALLISLPKKPNFFRPDKHPERAKAGRDKVLARIYKDLKIGEANAAKAAAEEVPIARFKNPYKLPHLVNRRLPAKDFKRRYTIDPAIQSLCEYRLRQSVNSLKKYGVFNGAMIIVDNSTMNVIAYAGSPDFSDKTHYGEIDGNVIQRSPGSTLKPLLYGLAMERGMVTPKKILYDIPREYDGYVPVNASLAFNGPMTAEECLTRSLNSTAVFLEYQLGNDGLLNFLRNSGFIDAKRREMNPGLSVVLGAYPLTLEELVTIYAGIANNGSMRSLRYTADQKNTRDLARMFSGDTAFIISDMLASGERPDLPQSWEFTSSRGKVAFKTGTSFGLRDAWCVGYTPDYTVGVWLGNANSAPSSELIGIKSAAPILMEIFNNLTRFKDRWYAQPDKVKKRMVCSVSGDLPGKYCPNTTQDYYIEGRTKNITCAVHKLIYTDKKSGLRVDPADLKGNTVNYTAAVIEDWPPEVATFIKAKGGHMPYIPPYEKSSQPQGSYLKPKIVLPIDGSRYILNKAMPIKYQKMEFKAAVSGGNDAVVWFLNGKPISRIKSGGRFLWTPEEGSWELTVQDSLGQADTVKFKVFEK